MCQLIQEAIELYVEALEEEACQPLNRSHTNWWRYRLRTPLCLQPGQCWSSWNGKMGGINAQKGGNMQKIRLWEITPDQKLPS